MRTFFELYRAYKWARQYGSLCIHLDITDLDECSIAFLEDAKHPGSYSRVEGHYMKIGETHNDGEKFVFIHFFENGTQLYAAMYTPDGRIYKKECLIIWDVKEPHLWGSGYTVGRCPDHFTLPLHPIVPAILVMRERHLRVLANNEDEIPELLFSDPHTRLRVLKTSCSDWSKFHGHKGLLLLTAGPQVFTIYNDTGVDYDVKDVPVIKPRDLTVDLETFKKIYTIFKSLIDDFRHPMIPIYKEGKVYTMYDGPFSDIKKLEI